MSYQGLTRLELSITSASWLALAAATLAQPPQYTVTELADPPASAAASPIDINENRQVVGTFFNLATGYFDGVMWDADGNPVVMSVAYELDIAESIGIQNDGTVLGASAVDANNEVQHGAIHFPDGTVTILPSLAGDEGVVSAAFDMNDEGRVVGRSALVATPYWLSVPNDAVLWENGTVHTIGTLGGFAATARRINNNSVIIGESNTELSDFLRGFVWTPDEGMQEIPPLGPVEFGQVRDLNDSNVIVGTATLGSNSFACMWTDHTKPPTLLESLPGDGGSSAGGINNDDDIVGSADTAQGSRARLWMDGKVYDLNDLLAEPLGYPISSASKITNNGLILARGGDLQSGFVELVLAPVLCAADLDRSGVVDVFDLLGLLAAWGDCFDCPADLDGDGVVGISDLLSLLASWGLCA